MGDDMISWMCLRINEIRDDIIDIKVKLINIERDLDGKLERRTRKTKEDIAIDRG